MADSNLTAELVRELLDYDHLSGVLTWRSSHASRAQKGMIAGSADTLGYRKICVYGRMYKAHRLAWLHAYGIWPLYTIDHIDLDPSNNAIRNLRDVPQSVNNQNRRAAQSNSKHGFLGVMRAVRSPINCWRAVICVDGRKIHIGCFPTPELAHSAYIEAKRRLHSGCTI